jgi:hypothetical protein
MLRAWSRLVSKRLFGGTRSSKLASRKSRSVRLGVEALETRELLSATVPGFSLNSGNLYHSAGSQQQLIDTGLQDFSVVNGKVYDFHTDGTLKALNGDGSGKAVLQTGVTKFEAGPSGQCYTLDAAGNLDVNGVLGWSHTKDFALGSEGTLYKLDTSGNLGSQSPGGNWHTVMGGVTGFALEASNIAYANGSYVVFQDPQYHNAGYIGPIQYIVPDNVYALVSDGSLYVNGSRAAIQASATASDGTRYFLDKYGTLDHFMKGNKWQTVETSVAHFTLDQFDNVYTIRSDGDLYVNGLDTRNVTFGIDGAGSVVYLDSSNTLSRFAPGSRVPQMIDSGVLSFLIEKSGSVIELNSAGELSRFAPGSMVRQRLDTGVHSYAIDGSGSVVELGLGGLLSRFAPGSATPQGMDTSVSSFAVDGSGFVIDLSSSGTLARFAPGSKVRQAIDGNVASYLVDGAGSVVDLNTSGTLARFAAGSAVRQVIDSHVTAYTVDGAGTVVAVSSSGLLARFAPGSTALLQLDTGVSKFALDGSGSVVVLDKQVRAFVITLPGMIHRTTVVNGVESNLLARFAPGSNDRQEIGTQVSSFDVDGSGSVVAQDQFGNLYRFAPGAKSGQKLDASVAIYAIDGSGSVVALEQNGDLVRFGRNSSTKQLMDRSVITFTLDASRSVVALERYYILGSALFGVSAPNLVLFTPGSNVRHVMAEFILNVQVDHAGRIVVLANGAKGDVERFAPGTYSSPETHPSWHGAANFTVNADDSVSITPKPPHSVGTMLVEGFVKMLEMEGVALISFFTAGALAPEGIASLSLLEAAAAGAACGLAGSLASQAFNAILFHAPFSWEGLAEGTALGAVGGLIGWYKAGLNAASDLAGATGSAQAGAPLDPSQWKTFYPPWSIVDTFVTSTGNIVQQVTDYFTPEDYTLWAILQSAGYFRRPDPPAECLCIFDDSL